jgi:hypothetical protein
MFALDVCVQMYAGVRSLRRGRKLKLNTLLIPSAFSGIPPMQLEQNCMFLARVIFFSLMSLPGDS